MNSPFALVRIHVPSSVSDREGTIVTHPNPEHVWDYIVRNHLKWRTPDLKLLYMTRRHMQEDTSLIVDAKDPDVLADFLTTHIASLKSVRGIWVLTLSKMRFFKVPLEHHGDFFRFTVTIDAMPDHIEHIYETISALKPGRDIMVNYIAHTFQSFYSSLMVSVLARSRNHIESFVEEFITPLEGVVDTETTGILRTMRLVSSEEWEESVGPYLYSPTGEHIKNIDPARDDSLIAGC